MLIDETKTNLKTRYDQLSKLIDSCQTCLTKYPPGRLRIKRQGNSVSYYIVDKSTDKNGNVSKDTKLIRTLAQKTYLQELIKIAASERDALTASLERYQDNTIEDVYPALSQDRKALITPYILPDDEYLEQWINKAYTPKGFKEGTPFFITQKGERVRSKSEQIIADRLYANNIPYKYECPIRLDDMIFHPDFTILRIRDRKVLYYEHCGRMDDPVYTQDLSRRFSNYQLNGIQFGNNLFATFESHSHPLDVRIVDDLIKNQFT